MSPSVSTARSVLTRLSRPRKSSVPRTIRPCQRQAQFHSTPCVQVVKPYLLADVGEGIREVSIIQWFVQPGARVAEFDMICEVQSDKSTAEITSRYAGVIKKLYYEAEDIALVGQPLIDIDVAEEDAAQLTAQNDETNHKSPTSTEQANDETPADSAPAMPSSGRKVDTIGSKEPSKTSSASDHSTLATPAVRHLSKEVGIEISDVQGTGKDGRVLKEDLQKYAASPRDSDPTVSPAPSIAIGEDRAVAMTGVQAQMFKTMTKSLSIPHFLYTDPVDFTFLNSLRTRLNSQSSASSSDLQSNNRISPLPFIIKAVSLTFASFPSLNAHLETKDNSKPVLTYKAAHNIGIAIDTPHGLVVPVIRNVQSHTILSLNQEIIRLARLARVNKLAPSDVTGATFTVSNIGSIGGGAVAPVIVSPQVAILAVGKARAVPAFGANGEIVRREEAVFSWSADHRVCDGAMVARAAEMVKSFLENIEKMVVGMR